jgi:hypothetical protein
MQYTSYTFLCQVHEVFQCLGKGYGRAQRTAADGSPTEPSDDERPTRNLHVGRTEGADPIVAVACSQFGGQILDEA